MLRNIYCWFTDPLSHLCWYLSLLGGLPQDWGAHHIQSPTLLPSCCCSVAKLCLALCDPTGCSTPDSPVLHYLPVCSKSCPLSQWCYLTISSSAALFSFCLQSFSASGSFPVNWLFTSDGQRIGASASVLPMNIQDWFHLELTGLISLLSKGLSRVFSSITIWRHQFFSAQPSLRPNSHIHTWLLEKPQLWLYRSCSQGKNGGLVAKLGATLARTVALQALSTGFSRQEYWRGLPFPSPGDLPDPVIEPKSPAPQEFLDQLNYQGSSRREYWSGLPFPPPVEHILSELSTMIRPSWVALHSKAHRFIELLKPFCHCKTVIHEAAPF